ncbi:MAG: hypothetical protein RLP14_06970, partial [Owenweeksia sp.]
DVTGFPDGSGDYTYNIYAGTSTVGAADSSNTVGTFVNLPAGDYAIEVIDNITGCTSIPVSDEVLEVPTRPDFESSASGGNINNTVCDPALAINSGSAYNG